MGDLPEPGPGRPHHRSYSEPGRGASLLEVVVTVIGGFAFLAVLDLLGRLF